MSIVWNWELIIGELRCLGDYRTHKGNPGLLFSTQLEFFSSMIGKSDLGRIIETASQGSSYDHKAKIFLSLIRE